MQQIQRSPPNVVGGGGEQQSATAGAAGAAPPLRHPGALPSLRAIPVALSCLSLPGPGTVLVVRPPAPPAARPAGQCAALRALNCCPGWVKCQLSPSLIGVRDSFNVCHSWPLCTPQCLCQCAGSCLAQALDASAYNARCRPDCCSALHFLRCVPCFCRASVRLEQCSALPSGAQHRRRRRRRRGGAVFTRWVFLCSDLHVTFNLHAKGASSAPHLALEVGTVLNK